MITRIIKIATFTAPHRLFAKQHDAAGVFKLASGDVFRQPTETALLFPRFHLGEGRRHRPPNGGTIQDPRGL